MVSSSRCWPRPSASGWTLRASARISPCTAATVSGVVHGGSRFTLTLAAVWAVYMAAAGVAAPSQFTTRLRDAAVAAAIAAPGFVYELWFYRSESIFQHRVDGLLLHGERPSRLVQEHLHALPTVWLMATKWVTRSAVRRSHSRIADRSRSTAAAFTRPTSPALRK